MNHDNAKTDLKFDASNKEIEATIQKVKNRFGFVLEKEDAAEFAKLRNELAWWIKVERGLKNPASITKEIAEEVQNYTKEHLNSEITLEEAAEDARASVSKIVQIEKERVSGKTKAILKKYTN